LAGDIIVVPFVLSSLVIFRHKRMAAAAGFAPIVVTVALVVAFFFKKLSHSQGIV
jgi:hypothetical protein